MILFVLLSVGAVLVAAGTSLRILKKEYLSLLQAMDQDPRGLGQRELLRLEGEDEG